MPRRRLLLRGLAFAIVLAASVNCVSSFFGLDDSRAYNCWVSLKKEDKNSLDAVFIGASNVTEFWQPLFGWADHGIAVWSLSVPGLTCAAIKRMIIEARKTQPDALYIICLNTFKKNKVGVDVLPIHHIMDYMPFSLNKLLSTHELVRHSEFRGVDALEFYLPIIRFHSRWDDLQPWVFISTKSTGKLSMRSNSFNEKTYDITKKLKYNGEVREPIPDSVREVFEELLDYCDAHHVNALFVKSPQVVNNQQQGHMNALEDILEARGYPCLDLLKNYREIDIDPRMDFYNKGHTNIHGSMKFSKAVGDYLVENYSFEDKRGLPGWETWDEGCQSYKAFSAEYTLPIEREHAPRFFSNIPTLAKPSVKNQNVKLTWKGIDDVDGYDVFRKADNEEAGRAWVWIAGVDAEQNEFTDNDLNSSTQYTYTVVPYRQSDGVREYGSFDARGVSVKT